MNSNLWCCFKILILSLLILVILTYTLNKYKHESIAKIIFFDKINLTKAINKSIISSTIKTNNKYNPNSYVPLPNKYVEFQCTGLWCGGWADRIDGIMGAMALALIQNRTFLIKITQPCLINHALKSNIIKWDQSVKSANVFLTEHFIYAIDNFAIRQELSTLDWTTHLSNVNIIKIKNNQDWLKALSSNVKLKDRIKQLGYEPEKFRTPFLFNEWYSKLFNLSPKLENDYKNFLKQAKPTSNTKLICVQIRIGGNNRANRHPDHPFNSIDVTKIIWNELRLKILNEINDKNYKIFITTDDDRVQEEAFKEFGQDKVVTNKGEILHIELDVSNLPDCTRIEKTLLDFHSLQNCDVAVTTSAYGKVGAWNRKDPLENLYVLHEGHLLKTNNSEWFFGTRK